MTGVPLPLDRAAAAPAREEVRERSRGVDRALGLNAVAVFGFLYVPIAVVIAFAFNGGRFVSIWDGFSTRWFGVALRDEAIRSAIVQSLSIAVVSTAIATLLGTATAWQLERTGRRQRAAVDALSYLRIMLPELVTSLGLLTLFFFLSSNGLGLFELGFGTVVVGHVTFNFTYVLLVVRARLAGMDPAMREAAMDLGAGPWRAFRRVVLPDLWPGIAAGALLAFTFSFDNFVSSFFLAGPDVNTLPIQLFSMIRFGLTPEVNAVSTLLFALNLLALGLFTLLLRLGRGRT